MAGDESNTGGKGDDGASVTATGRSPSTEDAAVTGQAEAEAPPAKRLPEDKLLAQMALLYLKQSC